MPSARVVVNSVVVVHVIVAPEIPKPVIESATVPVTVDCSAIVAEALAQIIKAMASRWVMVILNLFIILSLPE